MSTEISEITNNSAKKNGASAYSEKPDPKVGSRNCDRHLLSMVHKASRQIEVYLDHVFQDEKLSAREAHLLGYVNVYGPCSVSELIRVFGLKASTLTSMLDRMENSEFIHRKPNPDDRRSLLLHISDKGTDMANKAYKVTDEMAQQVKNGVTQQDLEGFEAVMKSLEHMTNVKLR